MVRISFGSPRQALRLIHQDELFPESHIANKRITYSFWNASTSEAHDEGYQTNGGAQVREFLEQPRDVVQAVHQALHQISKFIDISFRLVPDTGFNYHPNLRRAQRGRIRIMTDGNGSPDGSSHGPSGGHRRQEGETFFRPYAQGTSYEDVINGTAERRGWADERISFMNNGYHYIIHELQHSLGLGHGHDLGQRDTNPHTRESDHAYNTLQSYTPFVEKNTVLATPMPDDIHALQYIYGARKLNDSGTVYTFKRSDLYKSPGAKQLLPRNYYWHEIDNINTIDDSGGSDWLDFSDSRSVMHRDGVRVNLQPGGYIFGQADWRNAGSVTSHDSTVEIENMPVKGTRLSWRTNIENVLGTEAGPDVVIANNARNKIFTYGGNDFIVGYSGRDHIIAGSGRDHIIGGRDSDLILLGNGDRNPDNQIDRLDYKSHAESRPMSRDTVHGFGAQDLIDLNDLDGNLDRSGKQRLRYIGQSSFTRRAGEVRAIGSVGRTFIQADLTGNGVPDFEILLGAGSVGPRSLTASNFVFL